MKNPNRIEIYMTPEDRQRLEALALQLAESGVDVYDKRGNISLSAVIRHLVAAALSPCPPSVRG